MMSAQLAIPATTQVLKAILEKRLKAAYGNTMAAPPVSTGPPPRPPNANGAAPAEDPGLILYLHHAAPNPAWRNMYDPHVNSEGERFAHAPLVLDLHYLLTALGGDLEREVLLGVGMNAFHRNGIVPRPMIQQILSNLVVPANPARMTDLLGKAQLDNADVQPESITISQQALDLDLSTKLWSALQSPLRPSAFYLVTTVFLDVDEQFEPAGDVDAIVISARPTADSDAPAGSDEVITQTRPLP